MNEINDKSNIQIPKKDYLINDINLKDKKDIIIKDNENLNLNNINYSYINYDNNIINLTENEFMKGIKYGIDENGNPINISEYYNIMKNNNIKNKSKKPRIIAYIKKDKDKNNNELIDLNGNKILKKNKDGDYEIPYKLNVLIKNFDVQNPELRVNGERTYNYLGLNEYKINDINIEDYNEELSFPIDSTETNDITYQKNNNINIEKTYIDNYLFKDENESPKNKFMKIMKFRYGNKIENKLNNFKKENNLNKVNLLREKSLNSIKGQEIVSRTNNILYMNKSNDNIFNFNKSQNTFNLDYNIKTSTVNNNEYFEIKNKNFSFSKNRNNNVKNKKYESNSYREYSISLNSNFKNNLITERNKKINNKKFLNFNNILPNSKIIKSKSKVNINNFPNDILIKVSTNKKEKKKVNKGINNTFNNSININKSKNVKKKSEIKYKKENKENIFNNYFNYNKNDKNDKNVILIKKILKNNKPKINIFGINKKLIIKRRSNIISPYMKYSQNSYKINENKNNNINNIISYCTKIKKISKIPKISSKNVKCSVLTKEANNMVKNFFKKKNSLKSRNSICNKINKEKTFYKYISSPIINFKNKSFG